MRVVSNTSPLLYLHQIGRLDVVPRLYRRIVVPQAVADELDRGRAEGHDAPDCRAHDWMALETIPIPAMLRLITALGAGEAEALALALATPTDLLILDDAAARRLAAAEGLPFVGTLGVLLQAKRQRLVDRVMPLVAELTTRGFRITEELAREVARLAGEAA